MHDVPLPIGRSNLLLRARLDWAEIVETRVCVSGFFFFFTFSAQILLFMDPQISLFSNFFIKNGSHSIIYTFKNYFVTVFFSF